MDAEVCAKLRALQQEADFALWRAREANLEVRAKYAAALQGRGAPPDEDELAQLAQLESDAEAKYRDLRSFVRAEFDRGPEVHG